MSKVYVVQEPPQQRNAEGFMESRIDLSPAMAFGDIHYVLEWSDFHRQSIDKIVELLRVRMQSFEPDDYLVMMGNPTAMAVAILLAAKRADHLRLLYWNRVESVYELITLDVDSFIERENSNG